MPDDDNVVLADQDRVGEAELGDRGRDLRHLNGRMGPGIADLWHQPVGRHHLDLHGHGGSGMRKAGSNPGLCVVSCPGFRNGNPATQEWQPRAETQKKCLALAACRASAPRIPTLPGWNQGGEGAAGGEASGAPPVEDRGAPGLQEPCTSLRSWGNTGLKLLHLSRPKFDGSVRYNNVPGPPPSGLTTGFAARGFADADLRPNFSLAFRCLAMVSSDAAHRRHAVVRTTPAR